MEKIPEPHENPEGLHLRYEVKRKFSDGRVVEDPGAEYFVLRLDSGGEDKAHIAASRIAALAYAEALGDHLPKLREELKQRIGNHLLADG